MNLTAQPEEGKDFDDLRAHGAAVNAQGMQDGIELQGFSGNQFAKGEIEEEAKEEEKAADNVSVRTGGSIQF